MGQGIQRETAVPVERKDPVGHEEEHLLSAVLRELLPEHFKANELVPSSILFAAKQGLPFIC